MNKVMMTVCAAACLGMAAGSFGMAAEKLVGPDGKVLYYLHDGGRVSDPSGRTVGYMRGSKRYDREWVEEVREGSYRCRDCDEGDGDEERGRRR